MNIQNLELAIVHTADAVASGLTALLHFFAAHSDQLGQVAVLAETATGNVELVPETEAAAKIVQEGATILTTPTTPSV
jgi:1-aminocyclopropane-1-carboxylate deaminase/D-cysteine desulfhydrase-like pyridoxal-dependent ACC family enzyme